MPLGVWRRQGAEKRLEKWTKKPKKKHQRQCRRTAGVAGDDSTLGLVVLADLGLCLLQPGDLALRELAAVAVVQLSHLHLAALLLEEHRHRVAGGGVVDLPTFDEDGGAAAARGELVALLLFGLLEHVDQRRLDLLVVVLLVQLLGDVPVQVLAQVFGAARAAVAVVHPLRASEDARVNRGEARATEPNGAPGWTGPW